MKTLFLHFSDLHIKGNTDISELHVGQIEKVFSYFKEVDNVIIIISGDIAYSGSTEEYDIAEIFINKVKKLIKNKYKLSDELIQIFIVPGNHDLNFNSDLQNVDFSSLDDENIDKSDLYRLYLDSMSNFYDFAKKYKCFTEDKSYENKIVELGNLSISVELYNTAPFSFLGGECKDKGYHYIDISKINNTENNTNLNISIMHHNNEWFEQEINENINNHFYNNSSLVFCGHDHYETAEERTSDDRYINISNGGSLNSKEKKPSFNIIFADTDADNIVLYKYMFNGTIFKPFNEKPLNSHLTLKSCLPFKHNDEFSKELISDENIRQGKNFMKYFTFPVIEEHSYSKKRNITRIYNLNDFINELEKNKKLKIEGDRKSGKTILSKYLTSELSHEYITILINEKDFRDNKISNLLRNAFNFQYGSIYDYDEFLQFDENRKVLIVDNFDKIDKKKFSKFIDEYGHYFGRSIYFYCTDYDLNIAKNAYDDLLNEGSVKYHIRPFYFTQRSEIIKKECIRLEVPDGELDAICKNINNDIFSEVGHFQLTPDFILLYTDDYIYDIKPKSQKNSQNVFSRVYESSINHRIYNNESKYDIDEIYEYLKYLAYYMFENKVSTIEEKTLTSIINKCNAERGLDLDTSSILKLLVNCNLLVEDSCNNISFIDETLLAYFIALSIHSINSTHSKEQIINNLLDNLCFEIYRDVLLFYSYISGDTNLLLAIKNNADILFAEWCELNFEKNDISFLNEYKETNVNMKLPTSKDKEKLKEKKSETEQSIIEEKKFASSDIFNFDISKNDTSENKILKSLYYLDIVAKMLPSFRTILSAEDKNDLIEFLYKSPNKILEFMFSDLSENYDDYLNEILDMYHKTKQEKEITKVIIDEAFQKQFVICICSIYSIVSVAASSGKGIKELNKFNYNLLLNYKLLNLMMEAQSGNHNSFISKAIKIYKDVEGTVYYDVVALTIIRYLYENDINLVGNAQKLVDLYFGDKNHSRKQEIFVDIKNSSSIKL